MWSNKWTSDSGEVRVKVGCMYVKSTYMILSKKIIIHFLLFLIWCKGLRGYNWPRDRSLRGRTNINIQFLVIYEPNFSICSFLIRNSRSTRSAHAVIVTKYLTYRSLIKRLNEYYNYAQFNKMNRTATPRANTDTHNRAN